MAFVTTNNLDDIAIYLGIHRLPGEINGDFLSRIKRLAKSRYGTDQKTLVKSIIDQIGLEYKTAVSITCIHPFTATVDNVSIILKSFPTSGDGDYIRVFINNMSHASQPDTFPLRKLIATLDRFPSFTLSVIDESLLDSCRESILSLSNFSIKQDVVSGKSTILDADKIIDNSIHTLSPLMSRRVNSLNDLSIAGDYFFDNTSGYIELYDTYPSPFVVTFKEYNPIFNVLVSDFNLLSFDANSRYGMSDNFINMLELLMTGRGIGSSVEL